MMKRLLVPMIAGFSFAQGMPAASGADLDDAFAVAGENAVELRAFVEAAGERHGDFGAMASAFLVEHMPEEDLRTRGRDFLLENLDLALRAREEFPWAAGVPEAVFLNDVLPYASLDETREPWRAEFLEIGRSLVKDCTTAGEAAQALNREFFNVIDVHYDTGRKAPNQSPSESRALGMATCTGLSIILVDACRAVGVPARVVGTPLWTNKRGNHTWVEIFDGERWRFTGADEYDPAGLDRAWFTGDASKAVGDDWRHAIWATSWRRTGERFPMVWALDDASVPGVNVTARYSAAVNEEVESTAEAVVHLRLRERSGGGRIVAEIDLLDAEAAPVTTVTTRAGTTDLNDMPSVTVKPGASYWLRIRRGDLGEERTEPLRVDEPGSSTRDLIWEDLGNESAGLLAVREWLALLPEERHLSVPQLAMSKQEAAGAARLIFETLRGEAAEAGREVPDEGPPASRPWPRSASWPPAPEASGFPWLDVPRDGASGEGVVTARAEVSGQRVEIEAGAGVERIALRLSDRLLDLDEPVEVFVNGERVWDGLVERRVRPIWESLRARPDLGRVASAGLELEL